MSTTHTSIKNYLQDFAVNAYLFQQQNADRLGLHPTDLQCIHLVDRHGSLSAGQIGREIGLTSGATTALIDRVCKAGYIVRTVSQTDRRQVILEIDHDKVKDLQQTYEQIDQHISEILKQFSDQNLVAIERFLAEITQVVD
jgi:DNA-binding MarR family transcriptional regulator